MSALHNKVKKVVNLSTDTPEMKEAIQTVSDLIVHPVHENDHDTEQKSQSVDNERLFASLAGSGDIFGTSSGGSGNSSHNSGGAGGIEAKKRALRSDLEFRGLHLAEKLLEETRPLYDAASELEESVGKIATECQGMKSRLESTQTQTDELLKQAEECQKEKEDVDRRTERINKFLREHTLSREETDTLYNAELSGTEQRDAFLQVLNRISSIRQQCSSVIAKKHHMAGLQILDSMAQYQEVGMDRLYQWLHHQASFLESPESTKEQLEADEVMDSINQALLVLRSRKAYFHASLEAIIEARRSYVLRSFIRMAKSLTQSLTSSENTSHLDSSPNAASESVRVASDLLAWIHQTVASERDILEPLVELSSEEIEAEAEGSEENELPSESNHPRKTTHECLNNIMSVVCKPLQIRLSNILETTQGFVELVRLVDVAMFFYAVLHQILHPEEEGTTNADQDETDGSADKSSGLSPQTNNLCESIEEFIRNAWGRVWHAVSEYRGSIEMQTMVCPSDLSSPVIATETIRKLEDVLDVFGKNLSGSMEMPARRAIICAMLGMSGDNDQTVSPTTDVTEALNESVSRIVSSLVEPIIEGCKKATEGLNSVDASIFLLNTYQSLQSNLSIFESAAPWVQYLGSCISLEEEKLSDALYHRILGATDFLPKLRAVQSFSQDVSAERLSEVEGMGDTTLETTMNTFYSILYDVSFNALTRLKSPRMRERVKRSTGELLVKSHEEVAAAIQDSRSGYQDTSKIIRHSSDDIRTILNVDRNE
eukprot:gb/GECG01003183.1/.p1 GENE.gb/GECG01003183.1/~~gb/GECG01003183.1/.p1  ORF type:complete len:771 (+),score=119.57 gb/GECG01003183.1/:1-2313(+)